MTTVQATWHPAGQNTQEFTCGCEFEIEDIKAYQGHGINAFMIEEDSSLRNNGKEFKTHPTTFGHTLELFDELHRSLVLGDNPFSERTSIHVHVNVSQLSLVQARQLVLTYALVEPLLFEFVGKKRSSSIYCVPLNYTFLPGIYCKELAVMHSKWHKYTAFNIKPMESIGTVEFRHMYGTNDKQVFTTWLTTLKELFEFVRDTPGWNVVKALQEDGAAVVARMVLPTLTRDYQTQQLTDMLKDTALDVKLSVGGLTK